jgi:hypothetical protein
MDPEMRISSWGRRAVVVVAALASIATSPARWYLEAKVPPGTPSGPKGTLVTVEASHEPSVSGRSGEQGYLEAHRDDASPWSKSGAYYLRPGVELSSVSISGRDCGGGGGMCSACEPPAGSFVRIVSVEQVAPWSLSATGAEQSALPASSMVRSFTVEVDASRPVDLEAVATNGDVARVASSVSREAGGDGARSQRFSVMWYAKGDTKPGDTQAGAVAVRWTPRATVHGYCKGTGECRAPEGESVRIVSVTAR